MANWQWEKAHIVSENCGENYIISLSLRCFFEGGTNKLHLAAIGFFTEKTRSLLRVWRKRVSNLISLRLKLIGIQTVSSNYSDKNWSNLMICFPIIFEYGESPNPIRFSWLQPQTSLFPILESPLLTNDQFPLKKAADKSESRGWQL